MRERKKEKRAQENSHHTRLGCVFQLMAGFGTSHHFFSEFTHASHGSAERSYYTPLFFSFCHVVMSYPPSSIRYQRIGASDEEVEWKESDTLETVQGWLETAKRKRKVLLAVGVALVLGLLAGVLIQKRPLEEGKSSGANDSSSPGETPHLHLAPETHAPDSNAVADASCSAEAYSAGRWVWDPKSNDTKMTHKEQAYTFSGIDACGSDREVWWNLGADRPEQFDRFPKAHYYRWEVGSQCKGLRPLDSVALLQELVEKGGWYFIGGSSQPFPLLDDFDDDAFLVDSVSENHFFSLSCILGSHVVGFPNYTKTPNFDRKWAQHLYLNPASPLLSKITLPAGFNISGTPLVTSRRSDILFSADEIDALYRETEHGKQLGANGTPFTSTDRRTITVPIDEYIGEFLAPLPKSWYSTLIIATGAHWTPYHFSKMVPNDEAGVAEFFKVVSRRWVNHFQDVVGKDNERCAQEGASCRSPRRRAIIREYVPGHTDCGAAHGKDPFTSIQPQPNAKFMNMADMYLFNNAWKVRRYHITIREE